MATAFVAVAAVVFPVAFLAAAFVDAVSVVAVFETAAFVDAAFLVAVSVDAVLAVAALVVAVFVVAAFLVAVFVAAVFFVVALVTALVAVLEAAFTGLTASVAGAPCVVFFPPTSLAAGPVDLPDADCCTAVFFATMAAAPSHIVILRANRAGTINRLPARGNGARLRFARPVGPARQACMRCAQLPAG